MSVHYQEWTGHFSQVAESLRRALGQYASRNQHFKVGLTVDPETRWSQHKKDGWSRLVVVYRTSSASYAATMEDELIIHGWQSSVIAESWNQVRGGGGLRQGYATYFVYVLLA